MTNTCNNGAVYPYFVSGKVVKGYGRGSKQLGCPTANIDSDVVDKLSLTNGIYYGFAQLELSENHVIPNGSAVNGVENGVKRGSPVYPMCCSCGTNPYFNNAKKSLEVHILNEFGYDFYGSTLRVVICGLIRGEKNFNSLDELIAAIKSDIELTRKEMKSERWKPIKESKEFFL